jgi:hypothetical protein
MAKGVDISIIALGESGEKYGNETYIGESIFFIIIMI